MPEEASNDECELEMLLKLPLLFPPMLPPILPMLPTLPLLPPLLCRGEYVFPAPAPADVIPLHTGHTPLLFSPPFFLGFRRGWYR